jgi:hypothetical protein
MSIRICATEMKHEETRARSAALALLSLCSCLSSLLIGAEVDVEKLPPPIVRQIDFATDIRPIFEQSCLRCHGTERPKSKFSLATREAALKGGTEGIDIIPGDSAKSPLIHYVAGLVPDLQMPPPEKGDPLTREQIAVLRAWIDQGAVWEKFDPAQYAAHFSFTPAVRWVTVSGNARKFQEHQWVRRGFTEGVSDFNITQKTTNGSSVAIYGHALTEDYKLRLDLRKDEVGFARFGVEQFRKYYDDRGPYYRFQPSGFATQTRNNFRLERDLHMDVGKAFAEFGLTRPDWPEIVLGYEYQFKNGSRSIEEWGPVVQRNSTNIVTRHIYPAYKTVDEDVHVLRLDISHEIAGTHVENNLRVEFSNLETKRVADTDFPSGHLSPAALTETRETHEQFSIANALHGEKSITDWLFASAGYLFSHFEADATLNQTNYDSGGRPAGDTFWMANDITLREDAHVFNANLLGGPWDGFTAALGVANEWSDQRGFGNPNYREGDPNDPMNLPQNSFGFVANTTERVVVQENVILRYTKIPATVLFAEARLRQERDDKFEQQAGDHDFLRDTDIATDWQEYLGGFEVSPWRWASLNASYKYRVHESDFHDDLDQQPAGQAGQGYPAFIRSRETKSDMFEARLALRPASWLRMTLSYRLAFTDYRTETDPVFLQINPTNPPVLQTRGGWVFAGENDVSTYSANVTLTPWRRLALSGTVLYQQSRTWTADHAGAIVVPYRGDTYSVVGSSTFTLTPRTDLMASYSFSRARFAQHNAASALPLGIDYDSHGVQVGIAHRFNSYVGASVQYGFFDYTEPTAHGVGDYTAHMVFGMISIRLP